MSLKISHANLVIAAERWLREELLCWPVLTEQTGYEEVPDALGFLTVKLEDRPAIVSHMVDVKISRADFIADQEKRFRKEPWRGVGTYRWFLAPVGVLKPGECNELDFGLLEYDGGVKVRCEAQPHTRVNHLREINLLRIACRDGQLAARRSARECRPGRVNQPTDQFDAIVVAHAAKHPLDAGKEIYRDHPEIEEMAGSKGKAIRRANNLLRRMKRISAMAEELGFARAEQ